MLTDNIILSIVLAKLQAMSAYLSVQVSRGLSNV